MIAVQTTCSLLIIQHDGVAVPKPSPLFTHIVAERHRQGLIGFHAEETVVWFPLEPILSWKVTERLIVVGSTTSKAIISQELSK